MMKMPRGKKKVVTGASASPVMAAAEALLALDAAGVALALEIHSKLRAQEKAVSEAARTISYKPVPVTAPAAQAELFPVEAPAPARKKPGPKPGKKSAVGVKAAKKAEAAPIKEARPSTGLGALLGRGARAAKAGGE